MNEAAPQPDTRPQLLGWKLKRMRLEVPLTQAQLAAKARISRKRLSQHEAEERVACHITQFQRYAAALDCDPKDLMVFAALDASAA